ncbi:related to SSK1 - two-component signal transducer [Melanopsichium pennsylvanicum]|uniref:Related to SSK1 - two-component signal transducer n=2 Tax=Melanopsichium pennsylvanicum TaxID=63383 RepID=A0AAJ4XGE6_9BASI|nr:related to SSK1-two-component signal transducer [Melanopsichium pennsylvanicum 4]SNX81550.1 related to SSK1 - two-component signal transducer [Melanopsichium pennsylvanicum]
MSTQTNGLHGQTSNSSSNPNGSSDLNFTSSDSNDQSLQFETPHSSSKSVFSWPSEPLNQGRPSLPQESQKSVDDANREMSDRITKADQQATSQSNRSVTFTGLDHARLSAELAASLNRIEDDCRQQLSPTHTSFFPGTTSSLPILSSKPQSMHRTSSNGTNKSTGSDKADAAASGASQYPTFLPDMFRNAATMPLNLLRSLIPDNALPGVNDEGLSASTLQVPITSFNALIEACKALEWLAAQASNLENSDKVSGSQRNSTTSLQQFEDNTDFAYFDYLQLLQKVADVVSGIAASRGIDLVLDLNPKLQGKPADNQRHYKLGSCTVWADRIAMTFVFMSCISRLLHNAPVQSIVVLTSTLTEKDDTVVRSDSNAQMKLMVLSIGLRLILPRTVASTPELLSAISGTQASMLLDAFGARWTTEQSTTEMPSSPDRVVIDHSISVPVGQLPDPEEATASQQSGSSKLIVGPDKDELVQFVSTLNGKKVALYSSSQSLFASQLSKFLSNFGCDIAPVFSDSVDESSFGGNDHVSGKQKNTAVALTSGRPALVSYTSDIDRRVHPVQSPAQEKADSSTARKDGALASDVVDTAVLDPVTGVPVTFDNSSHQPATPNATPGSPSADDNKEHLPQGRQINPGGRRVVPFSFVIIDDDIVTLQKELLRIRSAVPLLKSALTSKSSGTSAKERRAPCPTLDHRAESSPQVNRLMASQPEISHSRSLGSLGLALMKGDDNDNEKADYMDESVSQTIIFFTSMKSYRLVRDTVQPIIDSASFHGVSSPPEIMVLPKPAGVKRILTALHLAEHKPVVRLPFLPIATSPLSPLTTHAKTWWTPETSQKQGEGGGIMTLTRRQTSSTDTDLDTMPTTPWSPVDTPKPTDPPQTPQVPLTSENLPMAGEAPAQGARARTDHTQETAKDVTFGGVPSGSGTTAKSAPRSTVSRQSSRNAASAATAAAADATSTQKSTNASSIPASNTSPTSSAVTSRSHQVSSPMPADALEYFSETAAKMGGSAASGMVIQSPDGRPAGIFFQPGTKPALSRGVSASSLRRGHQNPSDQGDRSESGARERRLTNRSSASSSASTRGGGEGSQMRNSTLPTLNEQKTADSTEISGGPSPQLQVPNGGKYPSGSMFAPQVGIQSVLNSSRPPMTTPLGPSAPSPQENASAIDSQQSAASQDASRGKDQAMQVDKQLEIATSGSTKSENSKTASAAGPKSAKSGELGPPAARKPPSGLAASSKSAMASPDARTASDAASRLQARQSFGGVTASVSDSKSKPSAVPQAGFMMGMGFTAPARPGRGPKKAPVREAVLPPIKVLIVEDNPINQRILSMFMGKKKIKYDVANNGREAVEKWKTGGYHLILMDIQLPVMDGIEATKEIRKLERNANIGILPNTPPAALDSRVEPSTQNSPASNSSLSGGSRLTAKGLVKRAVAGSDKAAAKSKSTDGPGASALVNGVGEANQLRMRSGGGTINPFRASVIIVALTASVLSSDRVEALAAGCNDFLNKPVSLPWLNQKILEWGSMMYLMYSGLSSDDIHHASNNIAGGVRGTAGRPVDKAQLHLGFGYGPAEKAKALANNLHLGDTLAQKKKKKIEEKQKMLTNQDSQQSKRVEQTQTKAVQQESGGEQQEQQQQQQQQQEEEEKDKPAEQQVEPTQNPNKEQRR